MKRQIKALIYLIMAISLACCTFIAVKRVQVETNYKNVEIAVRYNDVLRIAIEEDIPIIDVLTSFKEMGATTLFVKENTVAGTMENDYYSYKGLGEVSIVEGYILKFYFPEGKDIRPESRYIMTENKEVAHVIYESYLAKGIELTRLDETNGVYLLEIGENSSALTAVGVGFDKYILNKAAALGYSISLQLKNWEASDEASFNEGLTYLMEEIRGINNVTAIYFSDAKIPGAFSKAFSDFISENYELGFIEFSSNRQKGFSELAKGTSENGTDYKVVRLHTLEEPKVNSFSVRELLERYELALKERNNRVFLFKMPNTGEFDKDYSYIEEAITSFSTRAKADGFTISDRVGSYNFPHVPAYLTLIAGLASIMVFVLLMGEVGLEKTGYVLGALGILGYAGMLKVKPVLGCQLIALFGSIMFPSYAMIKGLSDKKCNLKEAILAFIKICVISFGGALTVIGALSKTNFALGIDLFAGVKLATTVPILLVLFYLIYKEHGLDAKFYSGILQKQISYGALFVIVVVGAVLAVYVTRSGNSGSTSAYELAFRQFLDNTLGVRPRTKEILIGYPILLAFLYYGYKQRYIIFVIFAIMGPISLVNTYAHIHTPILISLIRSGYGILIGVIVGLILIWLIKLVSKVGKKWQMQLK